MKWHGVALAVAVLGVGMFVGASPGQASATPCASAPTSVAVVVDVGDGSPVSAVCVPADSADNGAEVLAARARQLGTPPPRYASSGLLCAIDGYPSDGCGEQNGGSYAYWSYWHGTGAGWQYQNIGPASWGVRSDVVEGWRFEPHGAGNPSDPPPNGSPDATATCTPPAPPTSVEDTVSSSSAIESPTTSTSTPTSTSTSTSTTTSTSTLTSTSTSTSLSTSTTVSSTTTQAAAASVRVTSRPRHSSPWPAVGAGLTIAGLGATGVVVARRRRDT